MTVPKNEKVRPKDWLRRPKFFGEMPFHELLRFKGKAYFENFPDYSHFYDKNLRRSVEELYSDDIVIAAKANT